MVFERPVLLRRSVIANVEYALARRGFGRAVARQKATAALERTGLQDLALNCERTLILYRRFLFGANQLAVYETPR